MNGKSTNLRLSSLVAGSIFIALSPNVTLSGAPPKRQEVKLRRNRRVRSSKSSAASIS
jgi:hypothetical protein